VIRQTTRPQLESLIAIAASVAGAHRLEDVLEVAATRSREALGAGMVAISRWEPDGACLRTLINVGDGLDPAEMWPQDEVYPLADFPAAVELLRAGRAHVTRLDDAGNDPAELELLRELGAASSAAVPIVYEGTTWGELYATSTAGDPPLGAGDVEYMQAICGQIGLALGRAELFSRLSELAFEDDLTRLPNRRAVEERLEALAVRGEPTTLLLGDLDGLKAINDRDGHDAGDAALRATADALRAALVEGEDVTPARLGGDEFCVIMPGAPLEQAEAFAVRASALLAANDAGVTFSWGAAQSAGPDWKPALLLRSADVAQYQAKRVGGDCVRLATAPVAGVPLRRGTPRMRDRAVAALRLVEAAVAWLDGEGRALPATRRLEGVAELASEALDAASWSVSEVTEDGSALRTVAHMDRRVGPGVRVVRQRDVYPLADFPRTRRALCMGDAFHVDAADPGEEAAIGALLRSTGRAQLLAGAADARLVELFGDGATPPMDWAASPLRLLVREATSVAPTA
jgi:diguanylate cyclase (GGDEF)-like protein